MVKCLLASHSLAGYGSYSNDKTHESNFAILPWDYHYLSNYNIFMVNDFPLCKKENLKSTAA